VGDDTDRAAAEPVPVGPLDVPGQLRRRAAHLYGLIICGAVLAAATETARLVGVALAMLGTLVIYWVAEAYAHWMSALMVHQRSLTRAERRHAVLDGFPLVAASVVPVLVLLLEAVLGVDTPRGLRIALWVNAALLLAVGWNMSTAGGFRGWRRIGLALLAGLMGVAMVGLKTLLH
jgi:hypothetical protein